MQVFHLGLSSATKLAIVVQLGWSAQMVAKHCGLACKLVMQQFLEMQHLGPADDAELMEQLQIGGVNKATQVGVWQAEVQWGPSHGNQVGGWGHGNHCNARWHSEGGRFFAVMVDKHDKHALHTASTKCIEPHTTIVSDCWKGHNDLDSLNNWKHKTVDHSKNRVDPETKAHTNTTEGMWNGIKKFLTRASRAKLASICAFTKQCGGSRT